MVSSVIVPMDTTDQLVLTISTNVTHLLVLTEFAQTVWTHTIVHVMLDGLELTVTLTLMIAYHNLATMVEYVL